MAAEGSDVPLSRRCEILGVNRTSLYYRFTGVNPAKRDLDERVMARIDFWHTNHPAAGSRQISKIIKNQDGLPVGRKLIRRLMGEMGIYSLSPKPSTSKPGKHHEKCPYLLRGLPIYIPNQVWAIDITYIKMGRGHMYLTAIIDWHSRYIVGWSLSDTLDSAPVADAVRKAVQRFGSPGIINSDQGAQFTSDVYASLLRELGARQSMDGKARWVDNVIIERWFRSLKCEEIYINEYASPRELKSAIRTYVELYNNIRPHSSLGDLTPAQVYSGSFPSERSAV